VGGQFRRGNRTLQRVTNVNRRLRFDVSDYCRRIRALRGLESNLRITRQGARVITLVDELKELRPMTRGDVAAAIGETQGRRGTRRRDYLS
jgi:hypothetical protein